MGPSAVDAAVRAALADIGRTTLPAHRARVVVALSGGRDSMVLLDAAHRASGEFPIALAAVHVHHGLSPRADEWACFCAQACARRAVPLEIARVTVRRAGGESLEAAARAARYRTLGAVEADAVLLAHHADDQAETLLLQLMRGSGPRGLAAMPARLRRGDLQFVRPLLDVTGAVLAQYAAARELAWVEDESNADVRLRRNALRHAIVPALRAAFPGYPGTLVRAARHQAEAAELLDALAAIDLERAAAPGHPLALDQVALASLARESPARARNLLRAFLRQHALPAPSTARLAALVAQCTQARADARVRLAHGGAAIGVHGGRIRVHRAPAAVPFRLAWHGQPAVALPGGTLEAVPGTGAGLAATTLVGGGLELRPRRGGERLRLAPGRPRRSVTAMFQEAGTPWWLRDAWPLLWLGDTLLAVPGIAVGAPYAASGDMPGYELRWRPTE